MKPPIVLKVPSKGIASDKPVTVALDLKTFAVNPVG